MININADGSFLFDDACADTYAQAEAEKASFVGCWFLVDDCQIADIRTVAKIILGLHLTCSSTLESFQALVCHTRARTGARHSEAREQVKTKKYLIHDIEALLRFSVIWMGNRFFLWQIL